MDETQVLSSICSVALLCNQPEEVFGFQTELSNKAEVKANGEAGVLYELGILHVLGNLVRSGLYELPAVLQLERHT